MLGLVVLLVATAMVPHPASAQTSSSSATNGSPNYSRSSWALGVVVPNGVRLAGGAGLSWADVNNVTVRVTLPQINRTDGPVLAVLSLMTKDGNVLQLAAGIYPILDRWLTYVWFITDVRGGTESYQWLANGSLPEMSPGDAVALSLYDSSDVWNYGLSDATNHGSAHGVFPGEESSPPAAGNQEVFAMESYSENSSVFSHMGSLTVTSVTVDGMKVAQGLYVYSNLDWQRNPLFVVGGYAVPPDFIAVQGLENGTILWSYSGEWAGQSPSLTFPVNLVAFAILAVCLAAAAIVFVRIRTNRS